VSAIHPPRADAAFLHVAAGRHTRKCQAREAEAEVNKQGKAKRALARGPTCGGSSTHETSHNYCISTGSSGARKLGELSFRHADSRYDLVLEADCVTIRESNGNAEDAAAEAPSARKQPVNQ
jgi:hypothetical protein